MLLFLLGQEPRPHLSALPGGSEPAVVRVKGRYAALGEPLVLLSGPVRQFAWSPDGSTIIAVRRDLSPGKAGMLARMLRMPWDQASTDGEREEVWSAPVSGGNPERLWRSPEAGWLVHSAQPFGQGAALMLDRTLAGPGEGFVGRALLLRKGVVPIEVSNGDELYWEVSPNGRLSALVTRPNAAKKDRKLTVITEAGAVFLIAPGTADWEDVAWDAKGELYTIGAQGTFRVDLQSRSLVRAGAEPERAPEPEPEFTVKEVEGAVQVGDGAVKISGLALEGEGGERALLAGDAALASPQGDQIAYTAQGALFVRPVVWLTESEVNAVVAAREKATAMQGAKHAALALLMFATDADDVMPSNTTGWQDRVSPYAKERGLLNRFTYTFKGGDINKVDSPAETVLGFVQTPNGRAVAYVDGHVQWEPKK